jgi:hypothetical protein
MVKGNLLPNVKITVLFATTDLNVGSSVCDTTDQTVNTTLDMAGFEGVTFIAQPLQMVAAGTFGMIPKFGSSSGTLTLAATSYWGGTTTLGATTQANQGYFALEIVKPPQRYVGLRLHRATQNSGANVIAVQWGSHKMNTTSNNQGPGGSTLYSMYNTTAFGVPVFAGTTA